MVIETRHFAKQRGFMMTEMVMAMGILIIAMLPLSYSINSYQRAVAMEIVDGEIEILAAGAWHSIPEGTHSYTVRANALTNLPPGQFQLTRTGEHLRLQWASTKKHGIGPVVREVDVK